MMATTEIDKIPDTILSRSELHTFKKPSESVLTEVIKRTAKEEGFSIESEAAEVLALVADGSFRDAHGALQKIMSSAGGSKVTLEEVERLSGAPKMSLVHDLIDSLGEKNAVKAIGVVSKLQSENRDIKVFTKLLLEKVRAILLARISGEAGANDSKMITSATLLSLLEAYERVARSSFPDVALEASLLDLLKD
jgi:DNA polymerase-3 subunit gamma/tau